MGVSDLRVTVDQTKLRCVLDPALVLSHPWGSRLALRLTRVFEAWLTRSFWQVIDSSELWLNEAGWAAADPAFAATPPDPVALDDWITLRNQTDAGSWPLRWMGDCQADSQLQQPLQRNAIGGDDNLLERYEQLAAALSGRADHLLRPRRRCIGFDPLLGALDAVTLSATLEGALILCAKTPDSAAPWPVQALERLGLAAHQPSADGDADLFAAERQIIRQALAGAGVVTLLQAWPPLAVVHAWVEPGALDAGDGPAGDPWAHAQAWWYLV